MEWLRDFMNGRRGPDHLTLALLIIYWPFSLLGRITRFPFYDTLALICLAVAIFRVLSRDLARRERENQLFLKGCNTLSAWFRRHRPGGVKKASGAKKGGGFFASRKAAKAGQAAGAAGAAGSPGAADADRAHAHFPCPDCGQSLRIPRVSGEITVTCPKCGAKFDKRF